MKYFLVIVLIYLSWNLSATPELDYYTCRGENITIDIIYRYKNDIKKLYFESLTKNLDEHIKDLKSKGKLSRGKIHLEIMSGIWMQHSTGVEMYRYKSGYYCWLNGLVQPITQDYLTNIIDYFSSDSWESFCYNDSLISPESALKIFNKRIDSINTSINFKSRKVLELNSISICFQNDSLICRDLNHDYGQINYLLPFSKDSMDFITCGETIYAIKNNSVFNKVVLTNKDFTGDHLEQPWIEIYPKWINFRNEEGVFLSYSLSDNKFYKL